MSRLEARDDSRIPELPRKLECRAALLVLHVAIYARFRQKPGECPGRSHVHCVVQGAVSVASRSGVQMRRLT